MESRSLRAARKTAVAVVGGATTVTGIVLIPLPGPGLLITFGGLAILGSEFPAARRLVERAKSEMRRLAAPNDPDSNH